MAKDDKGHGSNAKGGPGKMTAAEKRRIDAMVANRERYAAENARDPVKKNATPEQLKAKAAKEGRPYAIFPTQGEIRKARTAAAKGDGKSVNPRGDTFKPKDR